MTRRQTLTPPGTDLPIAEVLPDLATALAAETRAVLLAPPGAGKTTMAPLVLADQDWATGRILMLEPRRVAARAAAERLATLTHSTVGELVGYRIRGDARVSATTRIEVVTEGILTRMIQFDPELSGVSAVIFDEFHERSLHADLGLALALEAQAAFREDLRILVMSATLDPGPVAALLGDAPVILSEGRAFPVETRWLDRPRRKGARFDRDMADLIRRALTEEPGGVLAFLPGAGEIRRVAALLRDAPEEVDVTPIYGALPFAQQRAALAPPAKGRRNCVLATAIAETSLTVPGVRVVVDGGLARRARFDPGSGMSRLVTEPVSRAEAEQRRGRAGRVAPGVCYRLWARAEEGALPAHPPAEISVADLTALALELAAWGDADGAGLSFLTPPPEGTLHAAQALLRDLGALDGPSVTAHGAALARTPLHPRLAHLLLTARDGPRAADLAALLEERDPLPVAAPVDMDLRLAALADPKRFAEAHPFAADRSVLQRVKDAARRLKPAKKGARESAGALLARAYPDRIGLRRKGDQPRYLLSGGRGAVLPPEDPLANERLLVMADLDGAGREATVRRAAPITQAEVEDLFADRIAWVEVCDWSPRERMVVARRRRMLGAIALEDRIWRDAPEDAMARAMTAGVRALGLSALPWSRAATLLRARVAFAGAGLPDFSDEALLADLETWLTPHLGGMRKAEDLGRLDLCAILTERLDWSQRQTLDAAAPSHFTAPTGTRAAIDYGRDQPAIAIRLQELFGLDAHPAIANGRLPLLVDLLSPAGRPVQTTGDLPGFWRSSYQDVRKDLRGRYPRHPWPEDPLAANPTRRARPRK